MTAATQPKLPTSAELERAAVHEATAIVEGKDECMCKTCQKARVAEEAERIREDAAKAASHGISPLGMELLGWTEEDLL